MGLQYYTIRFIDAGNGIKNVMELSKSELGKLRRLAGLKLNQAPVGDVQLDQHDQHDDDQRDTEQLLIVEAA